MIRASALLAALLLIAGEARAADPAAACGDAYDAGQRKRAANDFVEALALFRRCALPACQQIMRDDCSTWLREVEQAAPTVVIVARDPDGRDVADVRVVIDGVVRAERLDGLAMDVNPGTHVFRFESGGREIGTESLLIHEAEKNRIVRVLVPSAPAPAPAPVASAEPARPSRPVDPWPWIVGGAGVALAGAGVYFDAKGTADHDAMARSCAPSHGCSSSDVASAKRELVAGDLLIGAGIVAVGVAVWLIVRAPSRDRSAAWIAPLRVPF